MFAEGRRALEERAALTDPLWRRFVLRCLGLLLILILVAAFRSDGFHHPDEYFQTLEFASAKLGRTPLQDLAWEYPAQIRSWLQPGLYVVIARATSILGIFDPFTWAVFFRLVSGLLGWLSVISLCLYVPTAVPPGELRAAAVRGLCFAWFVPYLAVRTSSESLSGSCLVLGLTLVLLLGDRPGREGAVASLVSGLFFGLAFEFRYAVGVAVLGIAAWTLVRKRARFLFLGLGVALSLGLGALVDHWGYGTFVTPSYRYLVTNLIHGHAAQRFGSLPWYGFFSLAVQTPIAPLSLGLLGGAILLWIRRPGDPLSWASAPFFLVHSLLAHKEMRFLFPILPLAPLLLVLGLAPHGDRFDPWAARLFALRRSLSGRFLLGVNVVSLLVLALVPLRPNVRFERFVYERFHDRFQAYFSTPYSPFTQDGLPMDFYGPRRLLLQHVSGIGEVEAMGRPRFLFVAAAFEKPVLQNPEDTCVLIYAAFPDWLGERARASLAGVPAWDLYRCERAGRTLGVNP